MQFIRALPPYGVMKLSKPIKPTLYTKNRERGPVFGYVLRNTQTISEMEML